MNAIRPIRMEAAPAITVRAWRVSPDNPRHEAAEAFSSHPASAPDLAVGFSSAIQPAELVAQTVATAHKQMILVLVSNAAERPERRNVLSTYYVRQKAARWVRGANGEPLRETPLDPQLIGRVCVPDGFEPITPIDVLADPVGLDRTLVQQ